MIKTDEVKRDEGRKRKIKADISKREGIEKESVKEMKAERKMNEKC